MVRQRRGELEEFAGGETADEFLVGIEEVEGGEAGALDPPYVAKDAVLQFILEAVNGVEMQVDGVAVGVGMEDASDLGADFGEDAELFFQFAAQGLRRRFSGLDLAAGEFPLERERLVLSALTAEDFVFAQNECRHHLLGQIATPAS